MTKSHRISYLLVSFLTLLSLTLTACGGAATSIPPTVASLATTVVGTAASVATNVAPTVAAAATNVAPTVAAAETSVPATVAAVATAVAPTSGPASAANTLTFDGNFQDLISVDPAVAYEYGGILVDH